MDKSTATPVNQSDRNTRQTLEGATLTTRTSLGKSNPRARVTWTIGSFDEPEPEAAKPVEPAAPNVLKVAQAILAALDPFPDAYRAVLHALRTTFPHPEFSPVTAGP